VIVQASPQGNWAWLASRSGCIISADFQAIEAVDASGAVRGMVGYERFTPNSVMMHMAVSSPMAWRKLIPAAFWYAFVQLGLGLALGATPASNTSALQFARRVGFRETYRVKDGFRRGVDLVLSEMRREECRWISGLKDGFRKAS
jgi:hypothetical protein